MSALGEPRPNESGNDPHKHHRYANRVATAALLIALASAVFTLWQAKMVGEGNELTRKNNIVSQRAFVSFSNTGQYVSVQENGTPSALNFLIQMNNSGNTATRNLDFFMR